MNTTTDELFLSLEPADFEKYPTGIIQLERDGTVLQYNKAEAALAHREGLQTVGLNFWRDVAPCAAVKDFKGRFDHFAAGRVDAVERFDFGFNFAWGFQHVGIVMIRKAALDPITLIVTVRHGQKNGSTPRAGS